MTRPAEPIPLVPRPGLLWQPLDRGASRVLLPDGTTVDLSVRETVFFRVFYDVPDTRVPQRLPAVALDEHDDEADDSPA